VGADFRLGECAAVVSKVQAKRPIWEELGDREEEVPVGGQEDCLAVLGFGKTSASLDPAFSVPLRSNTT
jgi:hypothetical protein